VFLCSDVSFLINAAQAQEDVIDKNRRQFICTGSRNRLSSKQEYGIVLYGMNHKRLLVAFFFSMIVFGHVLHTVSSVNVWDLQQPKGKRSSQVWLEIKIKQVN